MKNILEYYYDIHPYNIFYRDNKYFFEYYDFKYVFDKCNIKPEIINEKSKLIDGLHKKDILMHKIIKNKDGSLITYVNSIPYILLKIYINDNKPIDLSEICYINNNSVNNIIVNNWINLWEIKNDYIESKITEVGIKFPKLCEYINYYIGLAENAICYAKNVNYDNVRVCISHYRINCNKTLYELYNPLSMFYDYYIRDISEYIKDCFFNEKDVYKVISEFFRYNYLTYDEALLLFSRLLYPSYFYDIYDDVISGIIDEESINKIVNKAPLYERFLKDVYYYFVSLYNKYFPKIDWLIKRSFN